MSALDALLRCFADDGVCIRDIYANELAEARAELAALRADTPRCDNQFEDTGAVCNAELVEVSGDTFCPLCNARDRIAALLAEVESVRAEERERCARIVDEMAQEAWMRVGLYGGGILKNEANYQEYRRQHHNFRRASAAIRATGKAAEERRSQP